MTAHLRVCGYRGERRIRCRQKRQQPVQELSSFSLEGLHDAEEGRILCRSPLPTESAQNLSMVRQGAPLICPVWKAVVQLSQLPLDPLPNTLSSLHEVVPPGTSVQ